MRRTYISPEYQHKRIYGTYNMIEESNFFGSKMLDIEDSIIIDKEDITYYQNDKGEQLNFSIESSLKSYNYSSISEKEKYHQLIIDKSQQQYQLDRNTRWILTIDLKSILENYLFSIMKKYRSFEGVSNSMTRGGDVNNALMEYIRNNVYNKYKLKNIDLYVSYNDLRMQNILKYKNKWNYKIVSSETKFTEYQTETAIDYSTIKIIFEQRNPSQSYNFDYFFVCNFDKI